MALQDYRMVCETFKLSNRDSFKLDVIDRVDVFQLFNDVKPNVVIHMIAEAYLHASVRKNELAWKARVEGKEMLYRNQQRVTETRQYLDLLCLRRCKGLLC